MYYNRAITVTIKEVIMKTITGNELEQRLKGDPTLQVIDVREAIEYQGEHLPDTKNIPLSGFEKSLATLDLKKSVFVLCRTGSRAAQAADQLQEKGCENVCVIEGGLEALKSAGIKTVQGLSAVWAMDRQVRFGAGLLVLIGILGSWLVHSGFIFLSLFVACGLIFSAATNTCGMALVLGRCPWNQVKHK